VVAIRAAAEPSFTKEGRDGCRWHYRDGMKVCVHPDSRTVVTVCHANEDDPEVYKLFKRKVAV
jgi:hypothetical protein